MNVKTFHKIIDRSSRTSYGYGKSDHTINNYYRTKINDCLRSVSVSRGIVGDPNDKEDEDQIKRQGFVLLVISVRVGLCTLSMKEKAGRKMKNEDVDSVDESKVWQVDVGVFFINTVSMIRAVFSYVKLGVIEIQIDSCVVKRSRVQVNRYLLQIYRWRLMEIGTRSWRSRKDNSRQRVQGHLWEDDGMG